MRLTGAYFGVFLMYDRSVWENWHEMKHEIWRAKEIEAAELTAAAHKGSGSLCGFCKQQAAYIRYEVGGGYIPEIDLRAECDGCGARSGWHVYGKKTVHTEEEAKENALKEIASGITRPPTKIRFIKRTKV